MLRLSSYGAGTAHGHPKSPVHAAPAPPTEALPPAPAARSSDILANRCHELKRIAKGIAAFYQGIAHAHHAHALALKALSHPHTTPIATPLQEASLFLHTHGWAQILDDARDTNQRTADAHASLASAITKDVVAPLSRCRVDLKHHVALLERDLAKHVDAVQRERDTAAPLLARLSASLTRSALPAAAPSLVPLDDPVLLRAQVEAQLRLQLLRENDLLAAVKLWSDRTEQKEKDTFAEIKRCWAAWEQANSNMLLGNQQLSMFLSATVDSVPPDAEWAHLLRLNHLVLPSVPPKTLDDVQWDGKGDPLTAVVLEGLLERQTSFLRSWKPAYFILTPSGHLHIYGPPPATATPATPPAAPNSSTDAETKVEGDAASLSSASGGAYPPLSTAAQHLLLHTSPHLSLNLALCTLGPMPTPAPAPADGERKRAPLDAVFTLIESLGKGGKGDGSGTKHVIRCKDERGWEEMGAWVAAIGKFCATPTGPPPPSPPTPTASATFSPVAEEGEEADARPLDGSVSPPPPPPPPRNLPPPPFPAPSVPALALPQPLGGPPPPLPPRDSVLSTTTSLVDETHADADADADMSRASVLLIEDDYDMSRALSGLGVGVGDGSVAEAPPEVPLKEEESDADAEGSDEAGEGSDADAGDLGRSLSRSGRGSGRPAPAPVPAARSGSVRSLAAAWESQRGSGGGAMGGVAAEKRANASEAEEEDGEEQEQGEEGEKAAPDVKGRKGKKKRKSKGGAAVAKPTERPLPLPSIDPEHADLGLPAFAATGVEEGEEEGDLALARSPPPIVLEEVEEAPGRAGDEGPERREA